MAILKNDEVVINFDACEDKLNSLEDFFVVYEKEALLMMHRYV